MGRPRNQHRKDAIIAEYQRQDRKDAIIAEYQRQVRMEGQARYSEITRAVGLFSNHSAYVRKIVKDWQNTQTPKGQLRECLNCEKTFASTGKHHRLCDMCRMQGEYHTPYGVSKSIHFATAGRY